VQGEFAITIVSDGFITVPIDIVAPEGSAEERAHSIAAKLNLPRGLLRSAKPVAARVEREHQWPAETVLSEGHRLVSSLTSLSEQSGSSAQRTTP
jgi:hypothetical protein